jgi:hypothetical protein
MCVNKNVNRLQKWIRETHWSFRYSRTNHTNKQKSGGNCTLQGFVICTPRKILLGCSDEGRRGWKDRWKEWERWEIIEGFSWNTRRKEKLGRPGHRWGDNIKMRIKNIMGMCGLNSFGWEWEPTAGFCGNDKEFSGSTKCGVFLNQLSNC